MAESQVFTVISDHKQRHISLPSTLQSFEQLMPKEVSYFFYEQLEVNDPQVRAFVEELISYLENRLAEIDLVICHFEFTMVVCAIDFLM